MIVHTHIHAGQLDAQQLGALRLLSSQLTPKQFTDLINEVCKIKPNELPLLLTQVAGFDTGVS